MIKQGKKSDTIISKIKNIYIVGIDIININFYDRNIWKYFYRDKDQATVIYYDEGKVWSCSYLFSELKLALPDFWQKNIQNILCRTDKFDNYEKVTAIIKLKKKCFENIIQLNSKNTLDFSKKLDDLFSIIFSHNIGTRIRSEEYPSTLPLFPLILYIDYKIEKMPILEDKASLLELIKYFYDFFKKRSVQEPYYLTDALIMSPIFYIPESGGATIINFQKIWPEASKDSKTTYLSCALKDKIDFIFYLNILNSLNNRLKELPFFKLSVNEYLKNIEVEDILLERYIKNFLGDRKSVFSLQQETKMTSDKVKDKIKKNPIYIFKDVADEITVDISAIFEKTTNAYCYPIIKSLNNLYEGSQKNLAYTYESITYIDKFISDFLRDMSNIIASKHNLSVQKKIKTFTWVVLIISFIAVLLTALSQWDVIKGNFQNLMKFLRSYF